MKITNYYKFLNGKKKTVNIFNVKKASQFSIKCADFNCFGRKIKMSDAIIAAALQFAMANKSMCRFLILSTFKIGNMARNGETLLCSGDCTGNWEHWEMF